MNKDTNKEELILVLDENGNSTGKLEKRSLVHDNLLWHNEIALWILNPEEKTILLQRRSKNKRTNPNKLALCMGHVVGFDSIEDTVRKEAKEELGIDISDYKLNKLNICKVNRPTNRCFSNHYYITANIPLSKFVVQKEELSEVVYINYQKFKDLVYSESEEIAIKNAKFNHDLFKIFDEVMK